MPACEAPCPTKCLPVAITPPSFRLVPCKPRTYAIQLGHTGRFQDSFDITIPAGYVVDETPDPVDVNVDFASYKSSVSVKGNLLHYQREYVVKDVEIPASKAPDFRKLQSAIMDDERSTAVLKRP